MQHYHAAFLAGILACAVLPTASSAAPERCEASQPPAFRQAQGGGLRHNTKSVVFYVSTKGNDAWSGRQPSPDRKGSNGPFASLERAQDAVRALRAGGRIAPGGCVCVRLRGGNYYLTKTFELGSEDGGTAAAPVVYAPYGTEKARVSGGRPVKGFQPVTDAATLARLAPECRGHVLQANLKAQGITDYGQMTPRGFGRAIQPAGLEVFFQDRPMQLARYPDRGWLRISDVPAGQQGSRFTYSSKRPLRWKSVDDVWVHGYWTYDWADSYERVASIDAQKEEVTTAAPHGVYGYTRGKRFCFLNVLEELDHPGEWYLDREKGILYFYPPAPLASGQVVVSVLEAPLVRVRDARHLRLQGLTIEASRADGVQIQGGCDVVAQNCTVRNTGNVGVAVTGDAARANGVRDCEICETGDGGIILQGGDRRTLTAGRCFAVNNHIHHYQRWCRTYRPGMLVSGVGNRVANNLIHDAPHSAIILGGNDNVVEYNEIHHVCQETLDAGAFYMGRDWSQRGNIVRCNYFHHLQPIHQKAQFAEVMAIYLDDWSSGTLVTGNVCWKAGRAILVGGGRDNTIINNVFVDCTPSIHVDQRGLGWGRYYFNGENTTLTDRLNAVNYSHPPYSERYPGLANILQDEPAMAKGNRILRNIRLSGRWIDFQDGAEKVVEVKDNFTGGDPGFVDAAKGDFRLKPGAPALKIGFIPIPPREDRASAQGAVRDRTGKGLPLSRRSP